MLFILLEAFHPIGSKSIPLEANSSHWKQHWTLTTPCCSSFQFASAMAQVLIFLFPFLGFFTASPFTCSDATQARLPCPFTTVTAQTRDDTQTISSTHTSFSAALFTCSDATQAALPCPFTTVTAQTRDDTLFPAHTPFSAAPFTCSDATQAGLHAPSKRSTA
jgi:hypothetical protein